MRLTDRLIVLGERHRVLAPIRTAGVPLGDASGGGGEHLVSTRPNVHGGMDKFDNGQWIESTHPNALGGFDDWPVPGGFHR